MKKVHFLILAVLGLVIWFRFFFQPSPPDSSGAILKKGQKWKLVACVQSWCKDCILEVPGMKALEDQVGKERLEVVLISDEDSSKRARFEELTGRLFKVQASEVPFKLQGIFVYPTTWLLDPEGKKVLIHQEGYDWSSPEVTRLILGKE